MNPIAVVGIGYEWSGKIPVLYVLTLGELLVANITRSYIKYAKKIAISRKDPILLILVDTG